MIHSANIWNSFEVLLISKLQIRMNLIEGPFNRLAICIRIYQDLEICYIYFDNLLVMIL